MNKHYTETPYQDDEIDLFELIGTLWHYRLIMILVPAIMAIATALYLFVQPVTWTARTSIELGHIAGVIIERPESIKARLTHSPLPGAATLSIDTPREYNNRIMILAISASSPERAASTLTTLQGDLVAYHRQVFEDARQQMQEAGEITPQQVISTYTYPTRRTVSGEIRAVPEDRRILVKTVIAVMSGLFLAAMGVLMYDYIKTELQKRREHH